MKIYFLDSRIDEVAIDLFQEKTGYNKPFFDYIIINAGNGYTSNINIAEQCKKNYPELAILTNQTALLDSEYGYKEEEHRFDIYLYSKEHNGFVCIEDLTDKLLRRAHNIERLYRAGHFDED